MKATASTGCKKPDLTWLLNMNSDAVIFGFFIQDAKKPALYLVTKYEQ